MNRNSRRRLLPPSRRLILNSRGRLASSRRSFQRHSSFIIFCSLLNNFLGTTPTFLWSNFDVLFLFRLYFSSSFLRSAPGLLRNLVFWFFRFSPGTWSSSFAFSFSSSGSVLVLVRARVRVGLASVLGVAALFPLVIFLGGATSSISTSASGLGVCTLLRAWFSWV